MGDSRRRQETAEVYCYACVECLDTSRRHWEQQEAIGSNRKSQQYTPQPLTCASSANSARRRRCRRCQRCRRCRRRRQSSTMPPTSGWRWARRPCAQLPTRASDAWRCWARRAPHAPHRMFPFPSLTASMQGPEANEEPQSAERGLGLYWPAPLTAMLSKRGHPRRSVAAAAAAAVAAVATSEVVMVAERASPWLQKVCPDCRCRWCCCCPPQRPLI